MKRYVKGARSERELLNIMYGKGYSVMRSAGSGVNSLSPDIIGFKDSRGIALECKAWESSSLSLESDKIEELKRWEANSGMETFIAWRMNGRGWFFIKLGELAFTGKNYTVTIRNAVSIGRRLEEVIS